MEIIGTATAAEYVESWRREGGMPKGIRAEVVRGLRMSASISKSQGRVEMATGYSEAADLIERAVQ